MTETPTTFVPQRAWFRPVARLFLLLVLAGAIAGFLYQNISEARDRRFNPMPGKLVDVGGYKMHIDCTGEGSPAVILDSGLGDSYISWRKVQPQIAKFSRVCSYDRAGLGYSDSSSQPRTSKVMAEELHTLLKTAEVVPPYVLVGHSMGGFDVRLFASLYRNEVAGMVLVDSAHPGQEELFSDAVRNLEGSELRTAEFLEFTMPFGIPRLMGLCDPDPVIRAAECNLQTAREEVAETKSLGQSMAETTAADSLGDVPLVVLSRDPDKLLTDLSPSEGKQFSENWEKMQEELAHLSTRSTHTIAKNSSHYIQLDRPDAVVEAARAVLDQARAAPSSSSAKP